MNVGTCRCPAQRRVAEFSPGLDLNRDRLQLWEQGDDTWRYVQKTLSMSFERERYSVLLAGACKSDNGQTEHLCNKSLFQKALLLWVENITNTHVSVRHQSKVLHHTWSLGHQYIVVELQLKNSLLNLIFDLIKPSTT